MSLCLLSPGQGGQSPDMFARLRTDPATAAVLGDLAAQLAPDALTIAADPARCFANRHAQPLLCLYALTVGAALAAEGIEAGLVAGYSVGELAAYGLAGALPAEAVLHLAGERARLMDAYAPPASGMLAVRGVRLADIEAAAAARGVEVAIRNGEDHAVLAGPLAALQALATTLGAQHGAHLVLLPITVPAHSRWLRPAVAEFAVHLAAQAWRGGAAPVIAGIDASIVTGREAAVASLSRQLATTIEWARVLDVAVEMGTTVFFEVGPGNALGRMALERHPGIPVRSLADFASVGGAVKWLQRYR
ncbi:MAG: acyltransferase domain-containing protein [Rhodocyclales bacterium]|nr:acyltransferase domain-containing protein [Rhodocyclales bacterium]